MSVGWRLAAVGAASMALIALWPLSAALSPSDVLQARLGCTALTAVVCVAIAFSKGLRSAVWLPVAIVSALAGTGALVAHFDANGTCIADYDNRPAVVGRRYTPEGAEYVSRNPGQSPSDLLLDAGGRPEAVWTSASIRSCRFWVSWGGLLAGPLFAACVGALIVRRGARLRVARAPATSQREQVAAASLYDAFLSYRHTEPDRTHAVELLETLESRGLRVAIDIRDFEPNQHFLSEMERCVKQSRFVLCVVTSRYLDSDHTSEEAIISKTLDLADRRKRLVPLIYERVELPIWLHGLVGIDFTESARVDPIERLIALVAKRPAT